MLAEALPNFPILSLSPAGSCCAQISVEAPLDRREIARDELALEVNPKVPYKLAARPYLSWVVSPRPYSSVLGAVDERWQIGFVGRESHI